MDNISKKIRNAMDNEFGRAGVPGAEGLKQLSDFKAELPEDETIEATGAGSAGGYVQPLFSEIDEVEKLKGGKSDNMILIDIVKKYLGKNKDIEKQKKIYNLLLKQLKKGIKVELEHTSDIKKATEIAMDHLSEDPIYYDKLKKSGIDEGWSEKYKNSIDCKNPKGFSQKAHCQGKKKKIETKEATSSSSSGSYVTPAAWSKSMSKKDWRGASKTQIPGGKFVQVKKKCTKFPYCNQGDIKALKLFENKLVDDVINKISKENNISKSVIKLALFEHFKKINKNKSN
jgi:hypothetical protein